MSKDAPTTEKKKVNRNSSFESRSLFLVKSGISNQGMGCEGACAHARVRCAVARVIKSNKGISFCGLKIPD